MTSKRHAKPTALQLINRLYRQSLAREKDVENQLAILRLDMQENMRMLRMITCDSKEAREDNLPTLWALRRAIDREAQGSAHLRVTARTLTDHCARLLREKETLQRRLYAVQELKENPLQWLDDIVPPQTTIHSHDPGKPCTEYCKTFQTRPQL